MFQHLLVPMDSSSFSEETVRSAVFFAKEVGARITVFYAKQTYHNARSGIDRQIAPISIEQFEVYEDRESALCLSYARRLCEEAGVHCDTLYCSNDDSAATVIDAVQNCGADLIFMAAPGRKGFRGLLMGSETRKILTFLKIPVLLHR